MATVHNTSAAEAPSVSSIVIQAQALAATVQKLQTDIRAALESRLEDEPAPVATRCHPEDRTDNRIRAYLASMRPIRGVAGYIDEIEEASARGRSYI